MWHTSLDVDREGLCFHVVLGNFYHYYASLAIERLLLVEDEVANAIVDIPAFIVFYGLQGVGMVTDQRIS